MCQKRLRLKWKVNESKPLVEGAAAAEQDWPSASKESSDTEFGTEVMNPAAAAAGEEISAAEETVGGASVAEEDPTHPAAAAQEEQEAEQSVVVATAAGAEATEEEAHEEAHEDPVLAAVEESDELQPVPAGEPAGLRPER